MLSKRVIVIGITGRSGSGKTTVAENVIKHFGAKRVRILSTDRYYHGKKADETRDQFNDRTNFDEPGALNLAKLAENIKDLKAGNEVFVPSYSMITSESTDNAESIADVEILIIEGIFALYDDAVRGLIDISVFVHAPADVAFARRAKRDKEERNYSYEHSVKLVEKVLRPAYANFIKPFKRTCRIYIDNTQHIGNASLVSIDPITSLTEEKMKAGVLLMLMGPSGAGKTTIVNKIIADNESNIKKVINYTTRPKRDGEVNGVDYHFISRDEYGKKLDEGFFIGTIDVGGHFYAAEDFTQKLLNGENFIMDCLPSIAKQMRVRFGDHCKTIFVNTESLEVLKKRMEARGENYLEIAKRMSRAPAEIADCQQAANFSLTNNDLNASVTAVKAHIPRKTITFLAHNPDLQAAKLLPAPAVSALGCN